MPADELEPRFERPIAGTPALLTPVVPVAKRPLPVLATLPMPVGMAPPAAAPTAEPRLPAAGIVGGGTGGGLGTLVPIAFLAIPVPGTEICRRAAGAPGAGFT